MLLHTNGNIKSTMIKMCKPNSKIQKYQGNIQLHMHMIYYLIFQLATKWLEGIGKDYEGFFNVCRLEISGGKYIYVVNQNAIFFFPFGINIIYSLLVNYPILYRSRKLISFYQVFVIEIIVCVVNFGRMLLFCVSNQEIINHRVDHMKGFFMKSLNRKHNQ